MVRRKNTSRRSSPQRTPSSKRSTHVLVNKRTRKSLVLKEIRYFQKSLKLIIPKLPFSRLVMEIMDSTTPNVKYRIQRYALEALQEAVEAYLVQFFEDCILLAYHAKRVTLQVHDFRLTRRLRGRDDIGNK